MQAISVSIWGCNGVSVDLNALDSQEPTILSLEDRMCSGICPLLGVLRGACLPTGFQTLRSNCMDEPAADKFGL